MTRESGKSKKQLLQELQEARRRIAELEVMARESKRIGDALRESERKIRAILDQTFQFIGLMEPDGTLIEANRSALEFGGLRESDVLGKPFWETQWWEHSPELQQLLRDGTRRAAAGEFVRFEAYHPAPDGGVRYVDVSLKPVRDDAGEVIFIIPEGRDITARKLAEEEVKKLALVVKYSSELVNMATMDGAMVFLNEAGCRMLGVDPEEVPGTNIMQVIPDHLKELVTNEVLPALLRGETWKGELQYRNLKTGALTDAHATAYTVPDPENGRPLFLANVSMDISEQKRAEQERKALEDQVRHAQKLESLGVLAGGIAHDFNNLLTGILGNAELALVDLHPGSPLVESIDSIKKAAVRAADLCKQMLAYSGRGKLVVEVIDLEEIAREMAHMLEVSISKKVKLVYDLGNDVPPIEADATQLRQILLNLITNASEAIAHRGGVVSLRIGAMECDREYLSGLFIDEELPPGTYSYIEVRDTGCGMDDETLRKIFDPFFTTKFTGRGLGLSAVLGITRAHRGAVKIRSEPGKGTTFQVLFPAVDPSRLQRRGGRSQQQGSASGQAGGLVLLVDDDEAVRSVGSKMLKQAGFDVITACDGREALAVFKDRADEIVLVLLDLTMPDMDGEETFHELRRFRDDVRVILFSGFDEQDVTRRFVGTGLAGFIQKPFTLRELRSKVKQLLG